MVGVGTAAKTEVDELESLDGETQSYKPSNQCAGKMETGNKKGIPQDITRELAATLIQKAYRGHYSRAQFSYITQEDVRRMIRDLDAKERGMCHLIYYAVFIVLYFAIVVMQRDMSLAHSIEASLRDVTSDYESPSSISDVMFYFQELSMAIYNGNEVESPCNSCELFNDTSLGFVPEGARPLWECAAAARAAGNGTLPGDCSYLSTCLDGSCDGFVASGTQPVVYTSPIVDTSPCLLSHADFLMEVGVTANLKAHWLNGSAPLGTQGWIGNRNKLLGGLALVFLLNQVETCSAVEVTEGMDDFYPVCYDSGSAVTDDLDASHLDEKFMLDPTIEYHEGAGGHVQLYDGGLFNLGPHYTLCSIENFKESEYLGQETSSLEIVFYSYNGEGEGLFAVTKIRYDFQEGGKVESDRTISAFPMRWFSVESERIKFAYPTMRQMYQSDVFLKDGIRLVMEIFFCIGCVINIVRLIKDIHKDLTTGRTNRTGWNVIRAVSCTLLPLQAVIWAVLAHKMAAFSLMHVHYLDHAQIESVIQNLEQILAISAWDGVYNSLTVINGILSLFVVFYTFSFHSQLSVVTETMAHSAVHLFHFLIVFIVIVCLFSAICYILFGQSSDDFKDISACMASLAIMSFGSFDYNALKAISNPLGPIVFFGFQTLVTLLMLNILLSIVLDAYEVAKSAAEESRETLIETSFNFIGRQQARLRGILLALSHGKETTVLPLADPKYSPREEKKPDFLRLGPLKGRHSALLTRSTRIKLHRTKIPVAEAKRLLMASPAAEATAMWYLRAHTRRKVLSALGGTTGNK